MAKSAFTLVELLVVLIIVGILAAVAVPTYSAHLVTMHRNMAKIALHDLAGRMEKFYAINNQYSGATLEKLQFDTRNLRSYYKLSIVASDVTYILRADALAKQADLDAKCKVLTLDEAGMHDASDSCWSN